MPCKFLLRKFYQATFSTESQLTLRSLQVLLSVFPDTVRALTVGILTYNVVDRLFVECRTGNENIEWTNRARTILKVQSMSFVHVYFFSKVALNVINGFYSIFNH